jgi:soluble lytic murein transglycosylase
MSTANKRRLPLTLFALIVVGILVAGGFALQFGYRRYFSVAYPLEYSGFVEKTTAEFDVEPSLIYAVIHTESGFDPDALSVADAKGLMQLTDDTYRWALSREGSQTAFEPQNLYDPATNIHYGVYVLTLLGEQFENADTVLAAYNAGQGRVKDWLSDPAYSDDGITLKHIPYPETHDYVRRVREAQTYYRRLYNIP